jgi:hypothetical protein
MQIQKIGFITPENLMSLEKYSIWRKAHKPELLTHRKLRSVALGKNLTLQFEDELTIRYQIQEMLRIEKIFEHDGITDEINAYAPLVPDGQNWKATLLIEYQDVQERRQALAKLIGIEDQIYIEIDNDRIYPIADEDLERETEEKTSAVHFLRWEFNSSLCKKIKEGTTVYIGCDHPSYTTQLQIPSKTLHSLIDDLE